MAEFDWRQIGDEAIRNDYMHLERRARMVADSLVKGYGPGRKPIEFRYINENEFNAFASLDGDRYLVEVNAAVPLLVMILFYRLVSDERVLPYLDPTGAVASDFALPFIIDHEDFARRVDWQIKANPIRAFAAGTIADLCNTFVILHEFAHVICGHTEGIQHYEIEGKVAELVSRQKDRKANKERRQAWEAEADTVAAALLMQYIDDLVQVAKTDELAKQVFASKDGLDWEHTLAILIAGLFAFFCYVQGTRRKFDNKDDHPHPQIRALLIRNVLVQKALESGKFDLVKFDRELDKRLNETLTILEDVSLFEPKYAQTETESDRTYAELNAAQNAYRQSCAKWRWFDYD